MKRLLLIVFLFPAMCGAQVLELTGLVKMENTVIVNDKFLFDSVPDYAYFIKQVTILDDSMFPVEGQQYIYNDPYTEPRLWALMYDYDNPNHHLYEPLAACGGFIMADKFHKQPVGYNPSAFCGRQFPDSTKCAVILFRYD